jgi:hypothetical protein
LGRLAASRECEQDYPAEGAAAVSHWSIIRRARFGFVYQPDSIGFNPSVGPFGNFNVGAALRFVSSF